MGWLNALVGRPKPVPSHVERVSALPAAATRLRSLRGFEPTGVAALAFKAPAEYALEPLLATVRAQVEVDADADAIAVEIKVEVDEYGYSWLVATSRPPDLPALVAALTVGINALDEAGLLDTALCAVVSFQGPQGRLLGIIYSFATRTYYPFVPVAGAEPQRDNLAELMVRELVNGLGLERDVSRWYPVWNAPGLRFTA